LSSQKYKWFHILISVLILKLKLKYYYTVLPLGVFMPISTLKHPKIMDRKICHLCCLRFVSLWFWAFSFMGACLSSWIDACRTLKEGTAFVAYSKHVAWILANGSNWHILSDNCSVFRKLVGDVCHLYMDRAIYLNKIITYNIWI
jgi:hypothetical protein